MFSEFFERFSEIFERFSEVLSETLSEAERLSVLLPLIVLPLELSPSYGRKRPSSIPVSERTLSNTELSEPFGPHRIPGRELSEFLSA